MSNMLPIMTSSIDKERWMKNIWGLCKKVTELPKPFLARGLDPVCLEGLDIVRVVTPEARDLLREGRWPAFRNVFPGDLLWYTQDIAGHMAAWRKVVWDSERPRKWRKVGQVGYDNHPSSIKGNVLWNGKSGIYLDQEPNPHTGEMRSVAKARDVVFVEGEGDFAAACMAFPEYAVFGLHSGSWTESWALLHIHPQSRIFALVDDDKGGLKHMKAIWSTLPNHKIWRFSNWRMQALFPRFPPANWWTERWDVNDMLERGIINKNMSKFDMESICLEFEPPEDWSDADDVAEWEVEPTAPSRTREIKIHGEASGKVLEIWRARLMSAQADFASGKYDAGRDDAIKEINALIGGAKRGLLDMSDVLHGVKAGYILTKTGDTRFDREQVVKSCYHYITGQRLSRL